MKGIVFTEFLEIVEGEFGLAVADRIIEGAQLAHGGAYTSVGTYDHNEFIRLIVGLSEATGIAVPDLMRLAGMRLFGRLAARYPEFFAGLRSSFQLLERIEDHIHVEVRKLYPDAELPTIICERPDAQHLTLTYRSSRPFGVLAEGLIGGCIAHFAEAIDMTTTDLSGGSATHLRFSLTRSC